MKLLTFNREQVKDIVANVVVFFLFITPLMALRMVLTQEMPWAHWLLIFPFVALLWVRKTVFNVRIFFIVHGGVLALPLLTVGLLSLYFPLQVFAFAGVIYSLRARTNGEWRPENRHAIHTVLAFAVLYFFMDIMINVAVENLQQFFFGATLVTVAAIMLVAHMQNIDERINFLPAYLKKSAPTSGILSANNRLISGFLVMLMGFGALALLSNNMWRLITLAVHVVGYGIMVLFGIPSIITQFFVQDVEVEVHDFTDDMIVVHEMGDFLFHADAAYADIHIDETAVWRLFLGMAVIVITPFVIMLFIFARAGIRKLLRNFFNKKNTDEDESLLPDDALGKLGLLFGDLASLLPRLRPDNRHAIRRAYAKKVNRHIKKGAFILPSDTPDIIAAKINPKENINDLTAQYEKVRYGRAR
ncbi:MAG: hypothetical protein FWC16_01450 [Defluviitaleaceae bacterium]|nr:hypothetical protein [Defluviitaleaceae bacterium]MCL2273570.1 hypothetical protein [Defluviitaleaceae bacterium]